MSVASQVPDAGTPIFDDRGYINPVWHSFFFMLLRRTGGTVGVDPVDQENRIESLEVRADEIEGYEYSGVPVAQEPEFFDLGYAWSHGVQTDPLHHAVVTANNNGFMAASDKAKLDGITAGAAVASVSGTAPITSTGGTTPAIGITPASAGAAGSMSAADKATIDAMAVNSTFTPTLTCASPGNLAITYSIREGNYTQVGRQIFANFTIATSAFTWTTASGQLSITGFPFPCAMPVAARGSLDWGGVTKAGYTQINLVLANASSSAILIGNGSGVARSVLGIADLPTGGTVLLAGQISYFF